MAATGKLSLFGIKPDTPHIGYGYIRQGAPLPGLEGAYAWRAFAEKPDKATAERYLAAGDYLWNSGIFVLGARAFIEELARLEPDILKAARGALAGATEDLGFLRLDAPAFRARARHLRRLRGDGADRAAAVLPIEIGWNDVGSWSSLWEMAAARCAGQRRRGRRPAGSTNDCFVYSERALVSTIGVKDLVIVDTPDALLVADRSRAQDVSSIVARLKRAKRKEHERHLRSYRPWGFFETLEPRRRASRSSCCTSSPAASSPCRCTIIAPSTGSWCTARPGDDRRGREARRENEFVYIAATQWHRLENPGKTPLEMIEVQIGSYLGEDDIVRGDDIYNRAPDETK